MSNSVNIPVTSTSGQNVSNEFALEQLDKRWAEALEALTKKYSGCGSLTALDLTANQRNEQKRKFLEDLSFVPDFTVRNGDDKEKFLAETLDQAEKDYMDLKEQILLEEKNEALLALLLWKINEKIAWLRLVRASQNKDMKRFQRYADFLHQKPDKKIDDFSLRLLHSECEKQTANDATEIPQTMKEAASALQEHLPPKPDQAPEIINLPQPDLVVAIRNEIRKRCEKLLPDEISPLDQTLSLEQITAYFNKAFQVLGFTEWKVVIDENRLNFMVRSSKKELVLPARYHNKLTFERIAELIYHEIATHILRYEKGRISNLQILGSGLDRYTESEEGLATLSEHMAVDRDMNNFSKPDRFLAVSLAMGVQGKKYTFREVFETMKAYYYYEELKKVHGRQQPVDEVKILQLQQLAQDQAWEICVRIFRGTNCGGLDGKDLGVCFSKDMLYFKGNIETWQLISHQNDYTFVHKLFVGKFAHNDPRQWLLLLETGTIEQESLDIDAMFEPQKIEDAKRNIKNAKNTGAVRKAIHAKKIAEKAE